MFCDKCGKPEAKLVFLLSSYHANLCNRCRGDWDMMIVGYERWTEQLLVNEKLNTLKSLKTSVTDFEEETRVLFGELTVNIQYFMTFARMWLDGRIVDDKDTGKPQDDR